MDASKYPVTFPYGATDGYFYGPNGIIGPYHKGDDRVMPIGTPVIINNTIIGLSGNTGNVSGPHLHLGKFVGGVDKNPEGKGFQLSEPTTVYDTGKDSTNGNYVRLIDNGGTLWVYLHLSDIKVTKGQTIGGDMATIVDDNILEDLSVGLLGRTSKGDTNLQNWIGAPVEDALRGFIKYPEHQNLIKRADGTLPNGYDGNQFEPVTYQVYKMKGQ